MKLRICYIIFIIFFLIPDRIGNCQQPGDEEILLDLFDNILGTNINEERIKFNESIIKIIDRYVESDSIFTHRFENLRYLGQILSPDSRLKIITWNLLLTDGTNNYFCYIISKGEKANPNRVFKLKGINMDDPPATDKTYSAEDWYGALYYAIQPFKYKKETFYVLLGLDNTNLTISTKVIDLLTFTEEGEILLGKDCFIRGDEKRYRDLLSYSADGVASLRFKNKKTIIFDHLVPVSQNRPGGSGLYVPEFSFDSYILKKGVWRFKENVEPGMRN